VIVATSCQLVAVPRNRSKKSQAGLLVTPFQASTHHRSLIRGTQDRGTAGKRFFSRERKATFFWSWTTGQLRAKLGRAGLASAISQREDIMLRFASLLACGLASVRWLLPESARAEPIPKGEVPTIVIQQPGPPKGQQYHPRCNLSISGHISHQLGWPQHIDFRFYHVAADGQLIYQGGGGVRTDDRGEFDVSFEAPRTAWKAGTLRIYAHVNSISAISGTTEITISDTPVMPIPERLQPAPFDSGVVIDLDDPPEGPLDLPLNSEFRIRSEFRDREQFAWTKLETVLIKLRPLLPNGQLRNVIAGSTVTRVFHDENDDPWFEAVVKVPSMTGDFTVTVETRDNGPLKKEIPPWTYELHVVNMPEEPADATEPG
jgi:hypothetical protein